MIEIPVGTLMKHVEKETSHRYHFVKLLPNGDAECRMVSPYNTRVQGQRCGFLYFIDGEWVDVFKDERGWEI